LRGGRRGGEPLRGGSRGGPAPHGAGGGGPGDGGDGGLRVVRRLGAPGVQASQQAGAGTREPVAGVRRAADVSPPVLDWLCFRNRRQGGTPCRFKPRSGTTAIELGSSQPANLTDQF